MARQTETQPDTSAEQTEKPAKPFTVTPLMEKVARQGESTPEGTVGKLQASGFLY
ncbi:MAG: hypothetical protein AAGI50_18255 [Pseudomonadota bacterium]